MIDAGFRKRIDTCDETCLYLIIDSLGGGLFYTRHDLADGRIESTPRIERWLTEAQEQIEYAVGQSVRLGVSTPKDEQGIATPEYWKWFRGHKSMWENLDELEQQEILLRYREK